MATAPVVAEAGRRGLAIPLVAFRNRLGGQDALLKVLRALTVTEKVHPGKPRGMGRIQRKAYTIDRAAGREMLYIPRLKGQTLLRGKTKSGQPLLDSIISAPDALRAPRSLAVERCEIVEPLFDYQESVVNHLCGASGPLGAAAIAANRGTVYMQMGTGLGKSRLGAAVLARLGWPGLVVVPTQSIGDQWIDEFKLVYPLMKVAFYHNPKKGSKKPGPSPADFDVIVVIINTFREKDPDFLEGFGTIILDEAHEYHGPVNSKALWLAQTRAVLGLSATPIERPDGLDHYVVMHLGPVLLPESIEDYDAGSVQFHGEARVIEYAGHPDYVETAMTPSGTPSAIMTIANIIKDPYRLRLIAAEVERLYRLHETTTIIEQMEMGLGPRPESVATEKFPAGGIRRHGVFVFAEHREYLPAIRDALLERMKPEEVWAPELEEADEKAAKAAAKAKAASEVSILRGGVTHDYVNRTREKGEHIVLTTYGFSRRGISLQQMTALVETSPRRNGSRQIIGRVLRRGSDESIRRVIVDIVDTRTALRGQFKDRKAIYKEKNYPLTTIKTSWEDFVDTKAPAQVGVAGDSTEQDYGDASGMTLDDLLSVALDEPRPGASTSASTSASASASTSVSASVSVSASASERLPSYDEMMVLEAAEREDFNNRVIAPPDSPQRVLVPMSAPGAELTPAFAPLTVDDIDDILGLSPDL
jgi:hypothetical protein